MVDDNEPAIAGDYARILVNLLREKRADASLALQSAGLDEQALARPGTCISVAAYRRLVTASRQLLDEPALGLVLGRRLNLSAHGSLGHAVLASGDPRDTIQLAARYMKTRNAACVIEFTRTRHSGKYNLALRLPVDDFYIHTVEEALASYTACLQAMGVDTGEAVIRCAYPAPAHSHAYRNLFGDNVRFDAGENSVTLPRECFRRMVLHQDPAISVVATRQCDDQMQSMEAPNDLPRSVRRELLRQPGHFPSQCEVAEQLNLSRRSLVRGLAQAGTSFTNIVNDTRKQLAVAQLADGSDKVEDIAYLLGYECPANFSRSFKRWTGMSPQRYRQQYGSENGTARKTHRQRQPGIY